MKKLLVVLEREYMERVRTRWFLVATVFGPVFFGALMFLPAWMANRSEASVDVARIRILDATVTNIGDLVAAELNGGVLGDTNSTQVQVLPQAALAQAESTATNDIRRKEIKGYLVLDQGTLEGRGSRYAGVNASALADMRRIENAVSRELIGLELRRAGIPTVEADRVKRLRGGLRSERVTQTARGGSGRVNILFASIVGILLYMTILMYGQNVLRGVIEEKQTRVAEVVVSSVRPTTLLAGKVLGVGAVGLTQMAIWLLATILMMRYRVPLMQVFGFEAAPMPMPNVTVTQVIVLLIFFLLGYTLYSALFAAVGAMVSSEQEAQQAQMPVVLMLVVSIMFLQPVLLEPDGQLAITLGLLPVSSPIMMPLRMSTVDVPVWEIGLSILALIAGCYLAVFFAATIYRTGLLMHGKRVTLREVFRWIRAA
ncbi:MAG TPA: ABC transporter permease [Gemmatimonadaceae bacterium]